MFLVNQVKPARLKGWS